MKVHELIAKLEQLPKDLLIGYTLLGKREVETIAEDCQLKLTDEEIETALVAYSDGEPDWDTLCAHVDWVVAERDDQCGIINHKC